MITKKQFLDCVNTAKNNPDGTVWHVMGKLKDGRELCLVFGYEEGYEDGEDYQIKQGDETWTLCCKLAVNIDDFQAGYNYDWYMPSDKKTGDVWDTDMAVCIGDGTPSSLDWYNEQAKAIIKAFDRGELEV